MFQCHSAPLRLFWNLEILNQMSTKWPSVYKRVKYMIKILQHFVDTRLHRINALMLGIHGKVMYTQTNLQLSAAGLFKYVFLLMYNRLYRVARVISFFL